MANESIAAAFFFAVVICAVSGAILFHLRDGASLLLRGGLRLVLAGFFCLITLWAVDGFIATFISKASGSACQIAVSFAGTCDQLARITLEEFIIWSTDSDFRISPSVLLPQAVMLVRFVLGGIFLGLQRSHFHPSCVTRSQVWPVAFSVLVADGFIMIMLLTRASSFGIFQDLIQAAGSQKSRAKSIILTTVALGIWILLSAPMILGVSSFGLAARTVLPAIGVLFVIACIAFFFKTLTLPPSDIEQKLASYADESPKTPHTVCPPTRKLGNHLSMSDETLVSTELQLTRQESKPAAEIEMEVRGTGDIGSPGGPVASPEGMSALPTISTPSPGQSTAGVGGLPVKGELFPPLRFESLMARPSDLQSSWSKNSDLEAGKLVISHPVIQEDTVNDTSQLRRMASVDLATAAKNEKTRRDEAKALTSTLTLAAANFPQSTETIDKRPNVELKDAPTNGQAKMTLGRNSERSSHAVSSSVLTIPSPSIGGSGSIRQRSPKHSSYIISQESNSAVSQPHTSTMVVDSTAIKSGGILSLKPSPSPQQFQQITPANSVVSLVQRKLPTPKGDSQSSSAKGGRAPMSVAVSQGVYMANQTNQTSSRAKSSASLDTLVPQVPPLSPRSSIPQTYYELEGSPIVPTRNMDSPSDASGGCSTLPESRPSTKIPITPTFEEDPRPLKTPVQLRKALGTPTNSRTKIVKAPEIDENGQAVLFIDSTDYDDSKAIQGIIEEISTGLDTKSTWGTEDSGSVVNRPRPITRRRPQGFTTSTKELPKLPERDTSPVQTMASSTPDSTPDSTIAGSRQLSTLPPTSSSAGTSNLITAKQSGAAGTSVASIPSTMHSLPPAQSSPGQNEQTTVQPKQVIAAGEIAICQAEILGDSIDSTVLSRRRSKLGNKHISNFSIATTTMSSDELSPTSAAKSPILICLRLSHEGLKRKSSQVLPLNDLPGSVTPVSSRTSKYLDNKSPALSGKRVSDLKLATTSHGANNLEVLPVSVTPSSRSSYVDEDDDRELVTIMLDRSWEIPIDVVGTPPYNRVYGGTEGKRGSWHRRIGESPPTFSGRNSLQSRRGSPPRPLELDKFTRVLNARPAPQLSPLETPQHALEMIQEQLKKLEEPKARIDDCDVEKEQLNSSTDIIRVEKGGEESHWKQMRDELARVSFSTNSTNSITIPTSIRKLLLGDSSDSMPSIDAKILSTQDGDTTHRSPTQSEQVHMRETDALEVQTEGHFSKSIAQVEDANTHMRDLSQPHTASFQNGEPEPVKEEVKGSQLPDLEPPIDTEKTIPSTSSQEPSLISVSELKHQSTKADSSEPKDASRRSSIPVSEDSEMGRRHGERRSSLQMPHFTATGASSITRPRTSRPPRRSRRISTLPDIVEDPEPLKNKRGTLGIFQFPWGERSDTATLPKPQPNQLFSRRPNTISGVAPLYPTLEAQTQILQSQGQSSSYFDCQEDDETVDEYAEDSDESCYHEELDDAFDETTLWEIANLLQTDQVPSRHSLLPDHKENCKTPLLVQNDEVSSESARETQEREVAEQREPNPHVLTEESNHRISPKEPYFEALVQSKNEKVGDSKAQDSSILANVQFFEDKMNRTISLEQESPTAVATHLKQDLPVSNTNRRPTQSAVQKCTSSSAPQDPSKIESFATDDNRDVVMVGSTSKANILWAAPNAVADQSVGLPQPDLDAWDKYNHKLGKDFVRSGSRKGGKLKIESQSLWSQGTPTPEDVQSQTSDSEDATADSSSDEEDPSSATAMITMGFALPVASSPLPEVEPSLKTPQAKDGMIPLGIEPSLYAESQDDILSPNPVGRDLWVPISMMPIDEDRSAVFEHSRQQASDNCKVSNPSTTFQNCRTLPSVRRSLPSLAPQSLWTAPGELALAHRSWVALSSAGSNASTDVLR